MAKSRDAGAGLLAEPRWGVAIERLMKMGDIPGVGDAKHLGKGGKPALP